MFFASDNWAGAHPQVAAALSEASAGFDPAYGGGKWDRQVAEKFNEVFEREVAVFFVSTGTAANSLSLASVARPGGVVFCHREAHIQGDECGAPEYFSGGSRLHPVEGRDGKMDVEKLRQAISLFPPAFVHAGQPAAISITQASEIGTLHTLDEIGQMSEVARQHGIALHMDGARFANALVALATTPAEMTWKRGVDMLSFGGTKNGCWCAEAVVLFDPSKARDFAFYHKRAAQLFSKSRFVAAQFAAYFSDDLWLRSARHANAMAGELAGIFETSKAARLAWKVEANEVFPFISADAVERLRTAGAAFYDSRPPHWYDEPIADGEMLFRFVTSFATTKQELRDLAAILNG